MKEVRCKHKELFTNKKSLSNHVRWCEGKLQRRVSKCLDCDIEISLRSKHCASHSKVKDRNPQWKNDEVGYDALHAWIKRNLIKPRTCEGCSQPKPLDLANISGEYKRDLTDWEWLCRSCHMKKDGRITKLHKNAIKATKGVAKSEAWKAKVRGRKRTAEEIMKIRLNVKGRERDKEGKFV